MSSKSKKVTVGLQIVGFAWIGFVKSVAVACLVVEFLKVVALLRFESINLAMVPILDTMLGDGWIDS